MAASRSREELAERLPGPVAKIASAQGGITAVAFLVLAATLPSVGLGIWSVPAIFGGGLVVFAAELWLDSRARGKHINDLETERSTLSTEVARLSDFVQRTQELEAERIELQRTVVALRTQLLQPASMRQVLGDLARQSNLLDLVQRHRRIDPDGRRGYPVTEVRLDADGRSVTVEAHLGALLDSIGSESVVLVRGEDVLAEGVASEPQQLLASALFPLEGLPEELRTQLERTGKASPKSLTLILSGFSLRPYSVLSDSELNELAGLLTSTTGALMKVFSRSSTEIDEEAFI